MRRCLNWAALTALIAAVACGGGGSLIQSLPDAQQGPEQESAAPIGEDQLTRNVLALTVPPLGQLSAGAEFDAVLTGQFIEEVFQGSARLMFDADHLEPVSASRGELIPASAVFMAKLNASGVVPFAFTNLPGDDGIPPSSGELLRVRFRLAAEPPASLRVRLRNDAAYLQLRDRHGRRLAFDLRSEVAAR